MRMRGKKPIFNYRDTFSLDDTLRPIISAGIAKFLEVKNTDDNFDFFGVPGIIGSEYDDHKDAIKAWDEILDKINYAFNQPEPNMDNYRFEYLPIKSEPIESDNGETMYSVFPIEVTNKEEHERYKKDSDEWEVRCQEGYELFGKYFRNLWW